MSCGVAGRLAGLGSAGVGEWWGCVVGGGSCDCEDDCGGVRGSFRLVGGHGYASNGGRKSPGGVEEDMPHSLGLTAGRHCC